MKIIDLLNRIANGEKIPKKIKLTTPVLKNIKILIYSEKFNAYFDEENFPLSTYLSDNLSNLNDEIEEIIEDKTDEIEEYKTTYTERCIDKEVREKLNEVIRAVNKLNKQDTSKDENCMSD